jgi:signal transduction histidine kinase
LNPLIETVVYRIAQEALTNIARHAQTNEACLGLEFGKDIIELNVSDPGIGFDQNAIPPGSWGLVGMQERAGISGGQLQVVTKPGCGTVINVRIPTT